MWNFHLNRYVEARVSSSFIIFSAPQRWGEKYVLIYLLQQNHDNVKVFVVRK
jgi:hypothetical protein